MLLPPITQIADAVLELRMCGDDLDGDELLLTLAGDLTCNVGELLHMIVPCAENGHSL